MKLLELKIQDFGQHRKRVDSLDVPIVGLLGANGSGKSTMLDAIQYALTGNLRDPMDTYIRDRGVNIDSMADPVKCAEVTLKFSIHGQAGTIMRRITPTTATRKLEWDGEVHKRAKDVDDVMADILGADKRAISEIVFPAQGELDSMLFGVKADREELFIKLLLVSYLQKVSDIADSKARLIRISLMDLTSQKDQLQDLINEQTQRVSELEVAHKHCQSWTEELRLLRQIKQEALNASNMLDEKSRLLAELENLANREKGLLEAVTKDHDGNDVIIVDGSTLEDLVATAKEQEKQLRTTLDMQLTAHRLQTQRASLEREINNAKAAYDEVKAEQDGLEAWEKQARAAQELPETAALRIKQQEHRTASRNRLEAIKVEATAAQDQYDLAASKLQNLEENEIPPAELALKDIRSEEALHIARVAARAACKEHGTSTCPVCDKSMGRVTEKMQDEDEVTRVKIAESCAKIQHVFTDLHFERDRAKASCAAMESTLSRLRAEYKDVSGSFEDKPDEDLVQLMVIRQAGEGKSARLDTLNKQQSVAVAQVTLEELTTELKAVPKSGSYNQKLHEAANSSIERINQFLAATSSVISNLATLKGNLASNVTRRAALEDDISTQREEQDRLLKSRSAKLIELLDTSDSSAESIMQQRDEEFRRADGALQQGREQLKSLGSKMTDLQSREAADEARGRLADSLTNIKETFQRKSLPMTYVQYRFEQLAELANVNLMSLDANFAIEVDPTSNVSLNFRRTDDSSEAVFMMSKLSGGQRVRLSIAFLLAVQQLIIPELGLLVLDEPSMHLNDEGVESLADLLQNLGPQLTSSDAQVIICDHDHRLTRAFNHTIKLS